MIKKIDIYLLKSFFASLLVVMVSIGLTIIIINVVEGLRDFIDHDVPFLKILEYYLYFGGWVIKSFLPMFILLALLFSLSLMARRNEILAMKASGLSLYRITAPFLVAALVLSAGHFYYNEYIFPPANRKRVEIKEYTIKQRSKTAHARRRNIFRQISPGYFYTIGSFDLDRMEGKDIKLFKTAESKLIRMVTAERVIYDEFKWYAINGMWREFSDDDKESFEIFDTLYLPDIAEKPKDYAKRIGKPEDMGIDALREYIKLMKRTGVPYVREAVDLQIKYSFPASSVVVVLICIPFATNPRQGSVAVSLASGAMIALVYFVLFKIMLSAGYNEKIPMPVAVWGVNGLFFIIGSIMLIKARK